jgi:hypothetical protein
VPKKKPNLPIRRRRIALDRKGALCRIEVDITQTRNFAKYHPDGIKAVFKVIRETSEGEFEEVVLIDNHEPLGFHNHDGLPDNHDSREILCASDYQEAWAIFDKKIKELFP